MPTSTDPAIASRPGALRSFGGGSRLAACLLALALLPLLVPATGCHAQSPAKAVNASQHSPSGVTNIAIGTRVIRSGVKRFGINLSGQSFYDSGQMLRDITARNPGFEGEIWQTVLQCNFVNGDACADKDEWSFWPKDFAKGGTFEFFHGAAKGQTGIVAGSTPASGSTHQGVWVSFGNLAVHPKVGDFYIVRMKFPGDPAAGWWPATEGGATITAETQDISKNSPGKQAIRLTALERGQSARILSGVDTFENRSFLQLKGNYTLNLRAKAAGGENVLNVSVQRLTQNHGTVNYIYQLVPLTNAWRDIHLPFTAHEDGTYIGPIQVTFSVKGAAAILDDAALVEAAAPDNPTVFRNAVVSRLRELHPSVLRYMDNGTNYGSSIDNLIAPEFARQRAGYSENKKIQEDIPIGLHDFLVLCQAIDAEPWFAMPSGISPEEARHLVEYLNGAAITPYGSRRAAQGQAAPWTSVFPVIHLELGNETWNWSSFPGEGIPDPIAYGSRAAAVFGAMRSMPDYPGSRLDLILGGFAVNAWWNKQELSVKPQADTIDIAPYTFYSLHDTSSNEAIFGPMFAEAEALDSRPEGIVPAQVKAAADAGVKLAVYEVNLSTVEGSATQAQLDSATVSVGAGIATVEHMLLMLRDDGITTQALFALPEFANGFSNKGHDGEKVQLKLWGSVVDMGGQTNRVRPVFAAETLVNSALASQMLETTLSGDNPTWDQPESPNGKIKLTGAHLLQTFAFSDGNRSSLVVFNLSRSAALPVTFSGPGAPHGAVRINRLTSAHITDTNEDSLLVAPTQETAAAFDPAAKYSLPPYSMTVLQWGPGVQSAALNQAGGKPSSRK